MPWIFPPLGGDADGRGAAPEGGYTDRPLATRHAPLAVAAEGAGVDLSTTAQMQQSLQTFSAVSTMSMMV